MRYVLMKIRHELGRARALENARTESEELARTLAAIDALGARLAARTAVHRAA